MSCKRKNARRLKLLRRGGVPIDGNYHVTALTVHRLGIGWLRQPGIPDALMPRMVDGRAQLYYLHPRLQRVILGAIAEGRGLA